MADNNVVLAFSLDEGILGQLKNLFGNLYKLQSIVDKSATGFKQFDNTPINLLPKSISQLKQKLNELKISQSQAFTKEGIIHYREEIVKTQKELDKLNKIAGDDVSSTDSLFTRIGKEAFSFNNINNVIQSFGDGLNKLTEKSEVFEYGMKKVNTMASLGIADFEALTKQVRNLADNVGVARDQLTEGLYQVISNGVPEDNWISFLENSSKTSVGGIADLGGVVKVTSTLIKNYGLQWDQAGLIQDRIQLTAKLGVTSFEELATALPTVSGAAATLKVKNEELLASFATLTGVSGNTSAVSTQLNAIYTALIKPSSEATKLSQEMKIAFDARSIEKAGGMLPFLQGLTSKIEIYSKKTGELPENIYATLFGSAEAMKAILPLTGQLANDFIDKTLQIENAAGTIDVAYSDMADSTTIRTQILQNSIDNFKDKIFELTKSFLPLTNVVTENLILVGSLAPGIEFLGKTSKITANGISKLFTMLRTLNVAQIGATIAQWNLNIAMLANPVGLIVAAIALAVGWVVLLTIKWNEFTNWFKQLPGIVKILAIALGGPFVGLTILAGAIRKIIDNWDLVKQKWAGVVNIFRFGINMVRNLINNITEYIKSLLNSMVAFFSQIWQKIKDNVMFFFLQIWQKIKDVVNNIWETIAPLAQKVWNTIKSIAIVIAQPFIVVKNWITDIFDNIYNFIVAKINKIVSFAKRLGIINKTVELFNEGEKSYKTEQIKQKLSIALVAGSDIKDKKEGLLGTMQDLSNNNNKTSYLDNDNNIKTGNLDGTVSGDNNNRNMIINMKNLIEKIEISSTNLKESTSQIKEEVLKAVLSAINDLNYA